MPEINSNYLSLQKSYLFTDIAHRVQAYKSANPDKKVISSRHCTRQWTRWGAPNTFTATVPNRATPSFARLSCANTWDAALALPLTRSS